MKSFSVFLFLLCASAAATPKTSPKVTSKPTEPVATAVQAILPDAIKLYEWFHRNPEVSLHEKETAAHIAEQMRALKLEVHEQIGGHGVVGIMRSKTGATKNVVLFRADMDALPVTEATGATYASQNPGVMHACGHDIHMATELGAMKVLSGLSDSWQGTIIWVAQPAEEIGQGARAMLNDPKFRALLRKTGMPKVALAIHDSEDLPSGSIGMIEGFAFANVDSVDVTVFGRGGHGAKPHETVDPIVVGSEIVLSLQSIVSRRVQPGEKAVITVGKFEAGTKHNIIPSEATLLLTVRSYSETTRQFLLAEIKRVVENVSMAHGAPKRPSIVLRDEFTPASYNDPDWTQRLRARFEPLLGKENIHPLEPTLGGEDFGEFSRTLKIPGVMWRVGGANRRTLERTKGKGMPGLHSDKWLPEREPTLRVGILTATHALLDALRN